MTCQTSNHHSAAIHQQGISLVELLVGMAISLLIIAVALGAIILSRNVTGSVNDSSQLQQQASHIFRILGQQLRQAGSLKLNLSAERSEDDVDVNDPVVFEATTSDFNPKTDTILGKNNPGLNEFKLSTGYRNYKEALHISTNKESLQRDCLGSNGSDTAIKSHFTLRDTDLLCAGIDKNPQPIANNVADFQVLYLIQSSANAGSPQLQYVNADSVDADNWHNVYAVEICLVLFGNEAIHLPPDSTYNDCQGESVNMSTLSGSRAGRIHKVFRSIFQLRSQGLIGNI